MTSRAKVLAQLLVEELSRNENHEAAPQPSQGLANSPWFHQQTAGLEKELAHWKSVAAQWTKTAGELKEEVEIAQASARRWQEAALAERDGACDVLEMFVDGALSPEAADRIKRAIRAREPKP